MTVEVLFYPTSLSCSSSSNTPTNSQALLALSHTQCVGDILCRIPNNPERDPHPERVEKDKIHPEVHKVARVEVYVTNEPLGAKGHEAWQVTVSQTSSVSTKPSKLTSVQLTGRQDNHPDANLGIPLGKTVADIHSQRPIEKHRQQLQAHNTQVNTRPSLIRLGIHHPQLRKRITSPGLRAIHAVAVTQEPSGRGEVSDRRLGDLLVREETVVEEAALEEEVAQRVGKVPDEEEAEGSRGRRGEEA